MIRAKAVVNFVLNRRMGQEWRRNITALNPECLCVWFTGIILFLQHILENLTMALLTWLWSTLGHLFKSESPNCAQCLLPIDLVLLQTRK
jgi:hypothetical protein